MQKYAKCVELKMPVFTTDGNLQVDPTTGKVKSEVWYGRNSCYIEAHMQAWRNMRV